MSQREIEMPQILTVAQAATALQMSTDSVLRLIRAGQLPAARLGRGYRLRPEALTEAVRRRENSEPQPAA